MFEFHSKNNYVTGFLDDCYLFQFPKWYTRIGQKTHRGYCSATFILVCFAWNVMSVALNLLKTIGENNKRSVFVLIYDFIQVSSAFQTLSQTPTTRYYVMVPPFRDYIIEKIVACTLCFVSTNVFVSIFIIVFFIRTMCDGRRLFTNSACAHCTIIIRLRFLPYGIITAS